MKNIRLSTFIVITMSIVSACNKNNLAPAADSSNPNAENKLVPGSRSDWIKPQNFVAGIANQYLPFAVGDTFFYTNVVVEDGDTTIENIYVTNTGEIKTIAGINCSVVHDQVSSSGIITEDTYDWYAQDIKGNIWYFGEDTKAYDSTGNYSTEGSFEAGVDGAVAGVVMPYDPEKVINKTYKQEFYAGQAEDMASVISTNETVTIGFGTFNHCVETKEFTPLEPGVVENKWYAPGVGEVLTTLTKGGNEHEELINIVHQ